MPNTKLKRKQIMKKLISKIINRETVMYIVFGVATTLVNLIVYGIFDSVLGNGKEVVADSGTFEGAIDTVLQKGTAGLIAWLAAVLFAYVTNRNFVFNERAHGGRGILMEFGRFMGARVLTGIIEIFMVPLLVIIGLNAKILGIDVAKFVVSVIVIVLNYVFSKLLVFKENKAENAKEEENV